MFKKPLKVQLLEQLHYFQICHETCGKGQRSACMARSDVDQSYALSTFEMQDRTKGTSFYIHLT